MKQSGLIFFVSTFCFSMLLSCAYQGDTKIATTQELNRDEVKSIATNMQSLAKAGEWNKVDTTLREALGRCPSGEAGKDCRPLLNYTFSYIKERQSDVFPQQRDELLQSAINSYGAVLNDIPSHGPSLNNLAVIYRKQGNSEQAITLLQKAMQSDPKREWQYSMQLADIYRAQQRWRDALTIYNRIEENNSPNAELARTNIIDTYSQMPDQTVINEMLKYIQKWQTQFPDATAQALRMVMDKSINDNKTLAENSLLSWVELLAQVRSITLQRLDQLPKSWPSNAIDDLRIYMKHPDKTPDHRNWWLESPLRRHVLAQVALALGHQQLAQQRANEVEAIWNVGQNIAPNYFEYRQSALRDRSAIKLDLQTELAGLYYNYPQLDRTDNKFHNVIFELFEGKASAYEYADLPTIQRHHTVLGMIYAAKPELENTGHRAMNSAFQLYHAIKIAEQRRNTEGLYQPLPNTKLLLAKVCASRHSEKQWCRDKNNKSRVPQLYLDAAAAYLDMDQIKNSKKMLEMAQDMASNISSNFQTQITAIEKIIDTRNYIAHQNFADLEPEQHTLPLETVEKHIWIYDGSLPGLPKEFIQRQQFKALFDLALKFKPDVAKLIQERLVAIVPKAVINEKQDTADRIRTEQLSKALGVI